MTMDERLNICLFHPWSKKRNLMMMAKLWWSSTEILIDSMFMIVRQVKSVKVDGITRGIKADQDAI